MRVTATTKLSFEEIDGIPSGVFALGAHELYGDALDKISNIFRRHKRTYVVW